MNLNISKIVRLLQQGALTDQLLRQGFTSEEIEEAQRLLKLTAPRIEP